MFAGCTHPRLNKDSDHPAVRRRLILDGRLARKWGLITVKMVSLWECMGTAHVRLCEVYEGGARFCCHVPLSFGGKGRLSNIPAHRRRQRPEAAAVLNITELLYTMGNGYVFPSFFS